MCGATSVEDCDKFMEQTPSLPKRSRETGFFIPINPGDPKFKIEKRASVVVVLSSKDSANDILEQFRDISNRDMILSDTHGIRYKLFTLVVNGYRYNYQRFIWSSNKRMYRLGTKEPNARLKKYECRSNFYLGFPIVQHIPISTILLNNSFRTNN